MASPRMQLRADRVDEPSSTLDGIPERTPRIDVLTGNEKELPLDSDSESDTVSPDDDRFFQGEEDAAESAVPDFDVVAPSQTQGKRRSWFPLWKFRKD